MEASFIPHTHVPSHTSHATGELFPLFIPYGSGIMAGAITRGSMEADMRCHNGHGLLLLATRISISMMEVLPLTTILVTIATPRWSWVREG